MPWFDRYSDIVPDFEAFLAALERPLPLTARINPVKASREEVVEELGRAGVELERLDWYPLGLRVEGVYDIGSSEEKADEDIEGGDASRDAGVDVDEEERDEPPSRADMRLGNTLPHFLGWIHVQEEVSMVPPVVLDASPDDVVLDLCAAPGSKTTQVAARASRVVANDASPGRIPALRNNCDRLGLTNVAVTRCDGRSFPADESFDAALVDAPCTGEGTVRKTGAGDASRDDARSMQGVQKGLLSRAVAVTRSGGTVVYSTCTFAPEENEEVVAHVFDDVEVVDIDLDLGSSPGLTRWDGSELPGELRRTRRFYPHQNDTGGFYVAKLRVL